MSGVRHGASCWASLCLWVCDGSEQEVTHSTMAYLCLGSSRRGALNAAAGRAETRETGHKRRASKDVEAKHSLGFSFTSTHRPGLLLLGRTGAQRSFMKSGVSVTRSIGSHSTPTSPAPDGSSAGTRSQKQWPEGSVAFHERSKTHGKLP